MKYLRKRNVHQIANRMLPEYEIPMCYECNYKYSGGYEWLTFYNQNGYVRFTVAYSGKWIRVFVKDDENNVIRDEVLKKEMFDYDS